MTHRRQRLTCYCDVISVITHSTSKWLITDHCFLRYLFVSSLFLVRVNDIVSRSNDTFSPPDESGRLTLLRSIARRAGLLFSLCSTLFEPQFQRPLLVPSLRRRNTFNNPLLPNLDQFKLSSHVFCLLWLFLSLLCISRSSNSPSYLISTCFVCSRLY